jgi:hypothetical protein
VIDAGFDREVDVADRSDEIKHGRGGERPADPAAERERAAREAFVRGIIERGEAAKPDRNGKLPPGVTHEIVEEVEGELPKIRRRRFSLR